MRRFIDVARFKRHKDLPKDFDAEAYLRINPDVALSIREGEGLSAEEHYLRHGRHEGRKYAANADGSIIDPDLLALLPHDFDAASYLELHGDIEEAIAAGYCPSAEVHYLNVGRHEGRIYKLSADIVADMSSRLGRELFRYPYRTVGAMPAFRFEAPSRGEADLAICSRIIAAWHVSAAANPGKTGGMWDQLTAGHTRLKTALARRDPELLSDLLANMFQEHLVHGLAMGRSTAARARAVPDRHAAMWCDRLLRFGEAVGVRPVRSPEQGGTDAPLEWQDFEWQDFERQEDFERQDFERQGIVSELEAAIGFELAFPPIGAPFGVSLRGSAFPEQSFMHAYAAWRINALGPFERVAEIGGGFGGLCAYLARGTCAYTIYDLPYTNILQGYFLLRCGLPVSLSGETPNRVQVLPWWEINTPGLRFDVVLNQDSIPEMSPAAGRAYIDRIKQIAPSFYSVNQEASALNTQTGRQLRVPELIRDAGGYRRLSRNLFWLRDGYVEEFYRCEG